LFGGPSGVFGNQRLRVVRRPLKRWQRVAVSDIAKRHADISEQAPALGSIEWRTPKSLSKSGFIQHQEILQRRLIEIGP
jgi:hypothetical protein